MRLLAAAAGAGCLFTLQLIQQVAAEGLGAREGRLLLRQLSVQPLDLPRSREGSGIAFETGAPCLCFGPAAAATRAYSHANRQSSGRAERTVATSAAFSSANAVAACSSAALRSRCASAARCSCATSPCRASDWRCSASAARHTIAWPSSIWDSGSPGRCCARAAAAVRAAAPLAGDGAAPYAAMASLTPLSARSRGLLARPGPRLRGVQIARPRRQRVNAGSPRPNSRRRASFALRANGCH